jgi:hypothetical protein
MNKEAYRSLDKEEIVTKDHYQWLNDKFVLLPFNHSWIGEKANKRLIYEKISLEDFRPLNDNEILKIEHFQVWRDSFGYLRMFRCVRSVERKAGNARKESIYVSDFNLYAKKETQINFGKFDFLKEIEL